MALTMRQKLAAVNTITRMFNKQFDTLAQIRRAMELYHFTEVKDLSDDDITRAIARLPQGMADSVWDAIAEEKPL